MAVVVNSGSLADATQLATTFTMSLTVGWDKIPPEYGGRPLMAGDLVLLEVRKPPPPVTGPSGWTFLGEFPWTDDDGLEHIGAVWWKTIGPPEREIPPTFTTAQAEPEWEIRGHALTDVAAIGDGVTGSAVPPSLPL